MQTGAKDAKEPRPRREIPVDDIGAYLIALACLGLIALGKETTTSTNVLLTVVGFLFGVHSRKKR